MCLGTPRDYPETTQTWPPAFHATLRRDKLGGMCTCIDLRRRFSKGVSAGCVAGGIVEFFKSGSDSVGTSGISRVTHSGALDVSWRHMCSTFS